MGNAEGSLFGFDSYVQIAACGTYRCRSQPLAPFSDGSRVALHVVGMLLAVVLPVGGARSVLLLSRGLCAAKGKVRNALRLQAALPPATSRLRAAQRGFRPKMAPAAEIGTCKFHKQRSARNYRIRKDFPPHCPCKFHKPRYLCNSRHFIGLRESIAAGPL